MTNLQYILYSIAAALVKAGESLKDSADNVPAGIGYGAPDDDGVIAGTTGNEPTLNTNPPAVDSAGLPWDERIHSGAKSIKKDGTWTYKKGSTPPIVQAVEAELRTRVGMAATIGNPPAGLPAPGAVGGVSLPAIGGLALPGTTPPALTAYQKLVAYLAAKTGPGKAADDTWVAGAFASWGMSLAALATDETNSALCLAEFKKVLGE